MTPLIVTILCAIIMMFSALFLKTKSASSMLAKVLSFILIIVNVYFLIDVNQNKNGVEVFFKGQYILDNYSMWMNTILVTLTFYMILLMSKSIEKVGQHVSEYYALIFFILTGINLVAGFGNLLILFLGIELLSIPQYILAGSDKQSLKSTEASLKYFLMGAFSTGILLMGIALLYGSMGTFNIAEFDFAVQNELSVMGYLGILVITIALGFKVSAAPMHFWTPDVYDGSPTPFTAFMATISKVGVFVGFVKIFISSFSTLSSQWSLFLAIIIAVTLIIGNFTALFQQSVKRMLAYSSIAQAGFMLLAVLSVNATGMKGIIIYAVAYTVASLLIFAILSKVKDQTYEGFNGFAKKEPFAAFVLVIALCSLAGIPLTAGFFAKFYVLKAALESNTNLLWLIILALVLAVLSLYYYFKLIMAMYFKKSEENIIYEEITISDKIYLSIGAALLIIIGISPDILLWI